MSVGLYEHVMDVHAHEVSSVVYLEAIMVTLQRSSSFIVTPGFKEQTRLAICVPRKSTHTTTEAIISKTMLYSGSIIIINTYIRESQNNN